MRTRARERSRPILERVTLDGCGGTGQFDREIEEATPFRRVSDLHVRYLPYGELARNREAMARFGAGLEAIEAVARTLR